jgi:hypothetical protein
MTKHRLFAAAAGASIVAFFGAAPPATAQTASGTAATYSDGQRTQTAAGVNVIGLENGTGAKCLVGSDTTCQLPGSNGSGGGGGAVTGAAGSFLDG